MGELTECGTGGAGILVGNWPVVKLCRARRLSDETMIYFITFELCSVYVLSLISAAKAEYPYASGRRLQPFSCRLHHCNSFNSITDVEAGQTASNLRSLAETLGGCSSKQHAKAIQTKSVPSTEFSA